MWLSHNVLLFKRMLPSAYRWLYYYWHMKKHWVGIDFEMVPNKTKQSCTFSYFTRCWIFNASQFLTGEPGALELWCPFGIQTIHSKHSSSLLPPWLLTFYHDWLLGIMVLYCLVFFFLDGCMIDNLNVGGGKDGTKGPRHFKGKLDIHIWLRILV